MKSIILFSSLLLLLTSCFSTASFEDDLRGVPVTNNPTLLPQSGQTAQAPGVPF